MWQGRGSSKKALEALGNTVKVQAMVSCNGETLDCQECWGAMGHALRKATGTSEERGRVTDRTDEGLWATHALWSSGGPFTIPRCRPQSFKIWCFHCRFWSCFDPIALFYAPFFSFEMGMFIQSYCVFEVCDLFMILQGFTVGRPP